MKRRDFLSRLFAGGAAVSAAAAAEAQNKIAMSNPVRWANIALQCMDCRRMVEIISEDFKTFTGTCDCGKSDLTEYVESQARKTDAFIHLHLPE